MEDGLTPDVTSAPETVAGAAAPSTATAPTAETTTTTQPRDAATGQWRSAEGASQGESQGEASKTTAPAVEAPTFAEIEARLGEQVVKLREDTLIPVGKDGKLVPLSELRRDPLLMADYTRKTQALAEQRREIERERVEINAWAERERANRERLFSAYAQGGEVLEKELRHQALLETDPDYRQRFEESESYRVQQQVREHESTTSTQAQAVDLAMQVRQYIREACAPYADVDPAEVEASYQMALERGQARLHRDDVDKVISRQRERAARVTSPLNKELEALRAELAQLRAEQSVQQGNAAVSEQIARSKAPPVGKPAAGQVPIQGALKPFNPETDNPDEYRKKWLAA